MTSIPRTCPACRRAGTLLIRFVEHAPGTPYRPHVACSAQCGWWTKMSGAEGDEAIFAHLPVQWRHVDGTLAEGKP